MRLGFDQFTSSLKRAKMTRLEQRSVNTDRIYLGHIDLEQPQNAYGGVETCRKITD